jgi:hypothetical protein
MPPTDKKGKKDKKKKAPTDTPSINFLILKRFLNLYENYSAQLNSKCCPDVIKAAKTCLEQDSTLTKVSIHVINIHAICIFTCLYSL